MSTSRFALLVGLFLGLVWAVSDGFQFVIFAAIFAAVGYVVGLVLEGRIDVDGGDLFNRGSDDKTRV
jgi:uncharacterized ion transporter superfamily protein YfcC